MRKFESGLSEQLELFLKQKRALGYSYESREYLLHSLDRYCSNITPRVVTITREIANDWVLPKKEGHNEKVSEGRLTVIREFAKFLIRSGIDAYIIPSGYYTNRRRRYSPHIFNDKELKLFFNATDTTPSTRNDPYRHLSVPVIFRLQFCCGLRPKEVLSIRNSDVDWDTGAIIIRESKNHKDRRVVIGDEMLELCKRYRIKTTNEITQDTFLFPAPCAKGHLSTTWLYDRFHDCLRRAGMTEFTGNRPRTYDFRHTFATQTLRRWLGEGRDLMNCIPYLSAFMGHEKFEYTQYYIHLVPEFFSESSGIDFEKFAVLLPEVSDEIS